jgi:hypothetical protein
MQNLHRIGPTSAPDLSSQQNRQSHKRLRCNAYILKNDGIYMARDIRPLTFLDGVILRPEKSQLAWHRTNVIQQ